MSSRPDTKVLLLLTLLLTACAGSPQRADQRFTALAEQIWQGEQRLRQNEPGQLTDMSPQALAQRQQQRLAWQAKLQQVNVDSLSEQNRINHAILVYRLADDIDEYRFGAHLMPLTAESGFHTNLGFLPQRTAFRTISDLSLIHI